GRRRGRAALVVGPLRRGDDDEALAGAVLVADAQQVGDVAEEERRVVAGRLDRRQLRERRREDRRGARGVADAEADHRVLREALQGLEGRREPRVERRRALQGLRPDRDGSGEGGGGVAQRAGTRAQLAEQRLAVGQERALLGEVLRRAVEGRRA